MRLTMTTNRFLPSAMESPHIGVMARHAVSGHQTSALRILRERAGLSQKELGRRANTSQQQIDKLEKSERKMTVDWIRRLAEALDCHPIELLGPKYTLSPAERAFLRLLDRLAPDDQEQLLRIGMTFTPEQPKPPDEEPRAAA